MILLLAICIVFIFALQSFNGSIIYNVVDQRFYSSVKSVCENSIMFNDASFEVYYDKYTLKTKLIATLNKNLRGYIDNYELFISYYYVDYTPCNYACKNVDIRLKVDIQWFKQFNKAYLMSIKEGISNE